ncbi:MAG TPA: O-antigen ligase domain-containing protein, partial [Candidatus Hydrogenedentes bacterium]|nr:O-antigen ligase domain-containing protein [Candidatus Hydrogenedentota bacterium]
MMLSVNKKYLPPLLWVCVMVGCACAWSFHLTSFLDAKGAVLAGGMMLGALLQWRAGALSVGGFRHFLPLWLGLIFWTVSGFFTARVLSFHIEKAAFVALALFAASVASDAFNSDRKRIWLWCGLLLSGWAVGALALLQYFGLINFLLPPFPGYAQKAYSVFGNQNLLGGYMAINLALLAALPTAKRKPSRGAFALAAFVFIILFGALLISGSRSAWLAALAGCAWGLAGRRLFRRPRHLFRGFFHKRAMALIIASVMILGIAAPLVFNRIAITFSERDIGGNSRIWFWAGAARMIAANPLFGAGLGNYAYWSPYYQGEALEVFGKDCFYHNELHTVHAHSEPLEWIAETGLAGCLFLVWFVVAARRRRRVEKSGLIAAVVFMCFNTISHS